ncbi:MAG: glycosyltransferase family 2 protein [Paracoccaceae bacterium]|nr:glycosyltransferase family 2 protein [Paracoccaceae bacterium]
MPRPSAFTDAFDLCVAPKLELSDVTAIVLCHNEALRLPHFLEHHKASGIEHFLVVDNASTDDSAAILDNDPDVTRIPSSKPYSKYKSVWREILADHYLVGKWAVFLDVDELLIHPTWQNESLPDYSKRLDKSGYDCLLSVMVDMYPESGSEEEAYVQGTPFVDYSPFFDTGNYRLDYYRAKQVRTKFPTPVVRIRGGARERLFHKHTMHHGSAFEKYVNRKVFSMSRSFKPSILRRSIDTMTRLLTDRMDAGPGLPNMAKIPLLKWRQGCKFRGGVHRIDTRMNVAPDLASLLHFKYLGDFAERVVYNAARGQHVKGGAHYKQYSRSLEQEAELVFKFEGSRRFTGLDSLKDAGLVRSIL